MRRVVHREARTGTLRYWQAGVGRRRRGGRSVVLREEVGEGFVDGAVEVADRGERSGGAVVAFRRPWCEGVKEYPEEALLGEEWLLGGYIPVWGGGIWRDGNWLLATKTLGRPRRIPEGRKLGGVPQVRKGNARRLRALMDWSRWGVEDADERAPFRRAWSDPTLRLAAAEVEVLWYLGMSKGGKKKRTYERIPKLMRHLTVGCGLTAVAAMRLLKRMESRGLVVSFTWRPYGEMRYRLTARGYMILGKVVGHDNPELVKPRWQIAGPCDHAERMRKRIEEARPMDLRNLGRMSAEEEISQIIADALRVVEAARDEKEREEAEEAALAEASEFHLSEEALRDPVKWAEEVEWLVTTKDRGLIRFEPFPYQVQLMRMMATPGQRVVIPKSRQIGVTTALMTAAAYGLLCREPWRMHIVANKEEVARERCLQIARLGLFRAKLPRYMREKLRLGGEKSTEIRYGQNYIRAHAGTPDVGRSFDGNIVLMDEIAYMEYAEDVYRGLAGMLDVPETSMWMVSTYNGDGDTFCYCVDHAEELGLTVIPMDWRVRPDRDNEWYENTKKQFLSEEDFAQEHELRRLSRGELVFDVGAMIANQARVPWIGAGVIPGHKYAKGLDISSRGECKTVFCAIDISVKPAQVVALQTITPVGGVGAKSRPEQLKAGIELIDAQYPGPLFVDGTNEKTLVELLQVRRKIGIHLTMGTKIQQTIDKIDRMEWWTVPRAVLVDSAGALVNFNEVVVHRDQFPQLSHGLGTVRRDASKRTGKFIDECDAFFLACLGLRNLKRMGASVDKSKKVARLGLRNKRNTVLLLRPDREKVW